MTMSSSKAAAARPAVHPALPACGLIAMALAAAACSSQAREAPAAPAAVPVTVGTVVQREVPVQIDVIGRVEAYSSVAVKAQVGGELVDVHFKEGQEVRKGDLLFRIDERPYRSALQEAEATLARDKANLANAQDVVRRYTDLVKKEYVTQEEFNRISSVATALEAVARASEARVETARLQLGYCTIRSPIAGRTGKLVVYRGDLVKANDDAPLVTINQVDPIYVAFSVPEQQLPEIKTRQAAGRLKTLAAVPAAAGKAGDTLAGELSFFDNTVDTATGTILLKATFENGKRELWPGQFVNVSLQLATDPAALLVPSQAVQSGQQGDYVYVVKADRTVEMRPVVVSRTFGSDSIVQKGVQKGETVVTDGQLRLVPGAQVEIKTSVGGGEPKS